MTPSPQIGRLVTQTISDTLPGWTWTELSQAIAPFAQSTDRLVQVSHALETTREMAPTFSRQELLCEVLVVLSMAIDPCFPRRACTCQNREARMS